MNNLVNQQEQRCFQLFKQLNNTYKWFTDIRHTKAGTRHDVECKTLGKPVTVELKERFKMYDTLFIRVDKYNYLLSKPNPLYIVFYKEKAYIFDLRKVKPLRKTTLKVWNPALNRYREEQNYELSIKEALQR